MVALERGASDVAPSCARSTTPASASRRSSSCSRRSTTCSSRRPAATSRAPAGARAGRRAAERRGPGRRDARVWPGTRASSARSAAARSCRPSGARSSSRRSSSSRRCSWPSTSAAPAAPSTCRGFPEVQRLPRLPARRRDAPVDDARGRQRRDRARDGHRDRLHRPPGRRADPALGDRARAPDRRPAVLGLSVGGLVPRDRAGLRRARSRAAWPARSS